MKNLLLTFSTISTLTLPANANVALNTLLMENKKFVKANNNIAPITSKIPIFNNKHKKLNDNDWITNQSKIDNKYYSYDTRHANYKLSDNSNARNAFIVDDNGQLQIKKKDSYTPYTPIDYNDLNNIKDEMIHHRQVTAINRSDNNAYTGSEFCSNIFTGDHSDWKFLQESQVEKHVNISDVTGANKVANNNNLSGWLALITGPFWYRILNFYL